MKPTICNQNGFTLTSVLLGLALTGLLMMQVISSIQLISSAKSNMDAGNNVATFVANTNALLSNSTWATNMLRGQPIKGEIIILDAVGNKLYAAKSMRANGLVLNNVRFITATNMGNNLYRLEPQLVFTKSQSSIGAQKMQKTLAFVFCQVYAGKVSKCINPASLHSEHDDD